MALAPIYQYVYSANMHPHNNIYYVFSEQLNTHEQQMVYEVIRITRLRAIQLKLLCIVYATVAVDRDSQLILTFSVSRIRWKR